VTLDEPDMPENSDAMDLIMAGCSSVTACPRERITAAPDAGATAEPEW